MGVAMLNFKDILAMIAFGGLVGAGLLWMSAPQDDLEFKEQMRAMLMAAVSGLYLLAYVLFQIISQVVKPRA